MFQKRKYYQRPEVKARAKARYQNNREKILARDKAYNQIPEVKEKRSIRVKNYYEKNKEKIKAKIKAHSQIPEIKAMIKARMKAYYQRPENKAKIKAYHQRPEIKEKYKALNKAYLEANKERFKKICLCCRKEFSCGVKRRKFCSRECDHKSKIKTAILNCSFCGKEKITTPSSAKNREYCSYKCSSKARSIIYRGENSHFWKPKFKKFCLGCNEEFEVLPCKKDTAKFCSKKCMITLVDKVCLVCKKDFKVRFSEKKGIYCSRECHRIAQTQPSIKFNCVVCGEEHETKDKRRFKYCSRECYLKELPNLRIKEKNPAWLGGVSFEPYGLDWTKSLRKSIRERDNDVCQLCNKHRSQEKRCVSVHHIDYIKTNNYTFNLITLCGKCHALTTINRNRWTKFFQDYLSDKYGYVYPVNDFEEVNLKEFL